jgi:riboflavin kinase/FMN adenylyltransferase
MRILRHTRAPAELAGAVLALGNFDGVHRGHRAVIARARAVAERPRAPLGVLTFEPHPRSLFQPAAPPFRLTPFRSKARHLAALGLDLLVVTRFDRAMSLKLSQDFVIDVLVEGLRAKHLVVGYDFVFGHKRGGTPQVLAQMAEMEGFDLTVVEPVADGSDIFSSTLIRQHLAEGRPRAAAELLGHWWEVEGRVRLGFQRGRTIGFPTANLGLADYIRPAFGVYAVRAQLAGTGQWIDGAANLGRRPTVGGESENLEVHLFDYAGDLYGKWLRVQLVEHIRPERKFSTFDELKAQIARDSATARELLLLPSNALARFPVVA